MIGCPDGGIGRRAGLKHLCLHGHAGSSPARGTKQKALDIQALFSRLNFRDLQSAMHQRYLGSNPVAVYVHFAVSRLFAEHIL